MPSNWVTHALLAENVKWYSFLGKQYSDFLQIKYAVTI